jgi:4a-hydroxytetrahydrobiopterin dehydratase
METIEDLQKKKCVPCEGGTLPMTPELSAAYLQHLPGWKINQPGTVLYKEFIFKGFADGMAFANKIAVIADEEDHHPDLTVSWAKVMVELTTHAIHGLSENDFILAAKIQAL